MAFAGILLLMVAACSGRDNQPPPRMTSARSIQAVDRSDALNTRSCASQDAAAAGRLTYYLAQQFPDGWRDPSPVSYATIGEIRLGSTRIELLRNGVIISDQHDAEPRGLLHDASAEEVTRILQLACGDKSRTKA